MNLSYSTFTAFNINTDPLDKSLDYAVSLLIFENGGSVMLTFSIDTFHTKTLKFLIGAFIHHTFILLK
jgi:hypothetical protein